MKTIAPEKLNVLLEENSNIHLYDVRSPAEFRSVHVPEAKNLPLDEIDKKKAEELSKLESEIYFICQSGSRSVKACQLLIDLGCDEVCSVEGGTVAWKDSGFSVTEGKGTISIERQVRIAAGVFVSLGILLSFVGSDWFLGLSLFVGLGLIFAGITDTCGMGLLLSRMPWNR